MPEPTHICCDVCNPPSVDAYDERPTTPDVSSPSSPPLTPSKSPNINGKRSLVPSQPTAPTHTPPKQPGPRRGTHLENARTSLFAWRLRTKQARYSPSSITATSLISDATIRSLASARHITTIEAIREHTGWIYAERHGDELLELLKRVDDDEIAKKNTIKAAAAAAREVAASEKAAIALEKREQKAREKAEKDKRRAVEREVKEREKERRKKEREEKVQARIQERADRDAARLLKRQKSSPEGWSSFESSFSLTTPSTSQFTFLSSVISTLYSIQ